MAYAVGQREEDLEQTPATKADMELLGSTLRSEIALVRSDVVLVRSDLGDEISSVRFDLMERIQDVEGQVKDLRVEMIQQYSSLRVSLAWMTVAVTGVLAGLITLFQFLS